MSAKTLNQKIITARAAQRRAEYRQKQAYAEADAMRRRMYDRLFTVECAHGLLGSTLRADSPIELRLSPGG